MTEPCIRGCTTHGRHNPPCTCTHECPDHPNHCPGCQPTPADTGQWCRHCTTRILQNLTDIPDLTRQAAAREDGLLPAGRRNTQTTRRPKQTSRTTSPAWETADEIINWAIAWTDITADHLHQQGPTRYTITATPGRNLTACITYLRTNITTLATHHPQDFYNETTQTHSRLIYATGSDHLTHRIPERCPSCDHKTLIREDGSDRVTCRNRDCGRIWREEEFEFLAHVAAT